MFEVLLQVISQRSPGLIRFRHVRRKTFDCLKNAHEYAEYLGRSMNIEEVVYLIDMNHNKTMRYYFVDKTTNTIRCQ